MDDGDDNVADTGPDVIPDVPDAAEARRVDLEIDPNVHYKFHDGQATIIVEDQSGELKDTRPMTGQRPDLKYETLETKDLDAQFAAQVEAATERYQRSLGDITAGAELGVPNLEQAAEAMRDAVNQLLEHFNANRR